ncbi:MAG: DNA repair exonuclease [Clostridia bacterium]|nr:DNA repair exonuclease [Clostridia bacterium]
MKIMHLADFHLDSAFSGFDRAAADTRRAELRECFIRAMKIARERGVDLILIPGDLFDTPFCTSATRRAVFGAIKDAGCPVVIAPGNHDYYNKNGTYADKDLPENAFVFTSGELGRFDFDDLGISVLGYAFTSDRYEENPLINEVPLSNDNINVLCAHTEIGVNFSKYAPMSAQAISKNGFVYAALGHVHIKGEPLKIGGSVIAYSGFPQGRSFDELGEGGAYIVDIDRKTKRVELDRIVLSTMTYEALRVDITSLSNDEDVIREIERVALARGYGENVALRVYLVGSIPSDYSPNINRILGDPAFARLLLLQIKNECIQGFDLEYLEKDLTVRGEVYRQLLPLLNSEDENERKKASLALKFALAALDKRELSLD